MLHFPDPSSAFGLHEHDYIGLSRPASASASSSSSSPSSSSSLNPKTSSPSEPLQDADLQLGLGLGLGLSLGSKDAETLRPQSGSGSATSANASASAPNVGMRRSHTEMALSVPKFLGGSSKADEKSVSKDQKHNERQTMWAPSKPVFSKWLDPNLKHPEKLESSEIHLHRAVDDAPPAKDQIVGWPPVRCFRRQALANPVEKLVKVNMDGITIGRKVDLSAYASYQSLMEGLEDMFQPSYSAQGTSRGASGMEHFLLAAPADFVLTYEDKDGDWMLVGDVPWSMFVSSVRRLRITRASETSSSAPRMQA